MDESLLALEGSQRAGEACLDMVLGEEARALLDDGFTPRQFLHRLIADGLWFDALALVAQGLPKRQAVEWACRCIRADEPDGLDEACLTAAERWVDEPSEENRRAASTAASEAGYATPADWAAAGAGWAEGSLGDEDQPDVPPPPNLTARAVSAAIVLEVVRRPAELEGRQRACLQRGLDLVDEVGRAGPADADRKGG